MATNDKVKVAVVGASGYSGIEAVRILSSHPFVELSVLTSEHYAGREVADASLRRSEERISPPNFMDLSAPAWFILNKCIIVRQGGQRERSETLSRKAAQ